MNNVKGYAIATDGSGKRLAITYDVVDDATGKIINSNKKVNRVVVDEAALEAIKVLDAYTQSVIDEE